MLDYTLDMYGGYGTVEVTGPSYLLNSSLIFEGLESNLVNDGTMGLVNSQLTISGGSLAGTGAVIATQGSTITAASSVPSQIPYPLSDVTPDPTVTATSTSPSEVIVLKSSTLNIGSGVPSSTPGPLPGPPYNLLNFFSAPVVMDAASTVNLDGPFNVAAGQSFGVYALGSGLGTLNNDWTTYVSGTMTVDANIVQPGSELDQTSYQIDDDFYVSNGGHLTLAGSANGGNVTIASGMLEFAQSPGFMHGPETASENFHSVLNFGLGDAAIKFDGVMGSLMIGISPQVNEVAVFNQGQEIADFHLTPVAPGFREYSAAEFSVRGNELLFHHITG
jgi:hypothetical protein